jgi:hypothetical protein
VKQQPMPQRTKADNIKNKNFSFSCAITNLCFYTGFF